MARDSSSKSDPARRRSGPRREAGAAKASSPPAEVAADGQEAWDRLVREMWQANPFIRILPVDPVEIGRAFQQYWLAAPANTVRTWATFGELAAQYTRLMAGTGLQLAGSGQQAPPVAESEPGDRRFSAPDWQQNALFDTLKQCYLLSATTLIKTAAELEGLDERQQRKLVFYLRQFMDAISPTNFAFTNPEVIHEALRTGGQSLARGTQNLLRDVAAGQIKMTDTDAFAPGRNLALTPGQVVHRSKLIELIQYAPATEQVQAIPLVIVPPWINKYYILDLQPQNSLIKFLVEQGMTVFVVSWKNPDAALEDTTFEDYLELGPLAALEVAKEITGSPKVNPVGYCVGGTLLATALAYLAAKGDDSADAATFFVSLVDFGEVGDTAVFVDEPQLAYMEQQMLERGYLDSRQMASMFNMLRANDLIWSNVVNSYLLGKEPPAFDLLYWNSDGTRMARAAHSYYLRNTYLENNLVKPNRLVLKNVPIDLGRIRQDIYAVGTEQDHIVPWKSAWQLSQLTSGTLRFILGASGHIAGVISPPSKPRGYWANDRPADTANEWLAGAERHPGSWWTDWLEWLRPRSGEQVEPPGMGSAKHPPIVPAPGTYVLEK